MKSINYSPLEMAIVFFLCAFLGTIICVKDTFASGPDSGYGVLVIPTVVRNRTSYPFCYYYSLLYEPKSSVKINIRPRVNKNFIIFKKFPSGKYSIYAIKSLTAPTSRVESFQTPKTYNFKRAMKFKVKNNTITILHYGFIISQRYTDDDFTSRSGYQSYKPYALSREEIERVSSQLRQISKFKGMPIRYKGKKRNNKIFKESSY